MGPSIPARGLLLLLAGLASAPAVTATETTSSETPRALRRAVPVGVGAAKDDVGAAYASQKLVRIPGKPPSPFNPPGTPLTTSEVEAWHYPELGVWFFFTPEDRVASIRVNAPFEGDVGGVRIGDTADILMDKRGPGTATFEFGTDTAVTYGHSDTHTGSLEWVRYDIDPSDHIVRIFR